MRDLGLVEAALLRPPTGYYAWLIEEAAALRETLRLTLGTCPLASRQPGDRVAAQA